MGHFVRVLPYQLQLRDLASLPGGFCISVVRWRLEDEEERRVATDTSALLADEPDARLNLMPSDETRMKNSIHSIFSFADSADIGKTNPYDLSRYLDRVSSAARCPPRRLSRGTTGMS